MKAVLTGREGPLRTFSGEAEEVEEAVANFFGENPTIEYARLDIREATDSLRLQLSEATRHRFELESGELRDAEDPEEWQTSVHISEDLDPSWALVDGDQGHLGIGLWSSNKTMLRILFDVAAPSIVPHQLWCRIGSRNPDVGIVDDQLGLITDEVMFESHEDSESFQLSITRRPDNYGVARAIVDFLAPPWNTNGTLAALYLLGLRCDGSLEESEFSTLASFFHELEYMDTLVVAPPFEALPHVRQGLAERIADTVQQVRDVLDAAALTLDGFRN